MHAIGGQANVYTKAGKLIRRLCGNRQIALLGPQPWAPFSVPLEERCLLPDCTPCPPTHLLGLALRIPAPAAGSESPRPRPSADSAAGAKKSFQESCERMGLSSLHTLRIHDPDSIEGVWDQAIQGPYLYPPACLGSCL